MQRLDDELKIMKNFKIFDPATFWKNQMIKTVKCRDNKGY